MRLKYTALVGIIFASSTFAQDDSAVTTNADVEPNNRATLASPFDPEKPLDGQLDVRDADFFRFTVRDTDQIRDLVFDLDTETRVNLCLYDAGGTSMGCTKGTSTAFRNLNLNGEYVLSLSAVARLPAPINYRLQLSAPRPTRAGREVEPNNRWADSFPVQAGSQISGELISNEHDSFEFQVQGERELMSIVAQGDAVAALNLQSAAGIQLHASSPSNGEVRMDNLQLPQGNYRVRLTSNTRSEARDYTLNIFSLGPPDKIDSMTLAPQAGASRPVGRIEAEPNNAKGNAQRIEFDTPHIGSLVKSDTDMYRFYLPGHGRLRVEVLPAVGGKMRLSLDSGTTVLSPAPGEAAVFEGELLPGDHYVSLRALPAGNGLYRLTMTQLDSLATSGAELNDVSVSVSSDVPVLAAYVQPGQRTNATMRVTNNGAATQQLDVVTHSSAHSWRPRPAETRLTLAAGQTKSIGVTVDVLGDARADPPVMLSLGVRNAAGAIASETLTLNAECGGPLANPFQLWPIPDPLLGRINAAALGLGAEVVDPQRRDADAFDGVVSRSRGAWGRSGDEITIDLAGDRALTVLGAIIHPSGSGEPDMQLREFAVLTSIDGTVFETVYEGELTADAVEHAIVFDQPVSARFARLLMKSSYNEGHKKIGVGEWKIVVGESAQTIIGAPLDIADNAIGGYDVYSAPFAGGNCCHDHFSTTKAGGHLKVAPAYEWVMAFHENRAAQVRELHWIDDAKRGYPQQDILSVDVEVSLTSPLGPWEPLGTWSLERGDTGVTPWRLEAPVWARYVKFNVPNSEGNTANMPQHIQIIEVDSGDKYRSMIGEWGYTSSTAAYEFLNPLDLSDTTQRTDAPDQRSRAAPLTEGQLATGDVLVGEDVDWYAIDVESGANQLVVHLEGVPGIEYAYEIQDERGNPVAFDKKGPADDLQLTVESASGRYYLKLFEPPRSIIFAWDTSGSVRRFYDVIDQTMKSFAAGVRNGREEINLQPFNDPHQDFLLDDWSGSTGVVSNGIVNSDRKFASSNVESSLLFSSKALYEREGTRAVLLITDAETDGYGLTDSLWRSLGEVRPRVFTFELSSAGSATAQDLMQSYAAVNNGFYTQALSSGDLQIGFDRATCMLRRPKAYQLRAEFETVAPQPNGMLQVALEAPSVAGDAVEVILDASGSMYQKLDGRFRYEIAKEVLDGLVEETLPDGIGFALRVFGNRDPSTCRTDLEVELGPLNRSAARSVIAGIEPQQFAYTPIADSLANVASDLGSATGRKTVVLVTDGEESCDGDVEATIDELMQAGIDVQLNVIGFDFDAEDKAIAREQFQSWATQGGGEYFDARNADELAESLALAVNASTYYEVLNANGDVVIAEAAYGEIVELRPGRYQVRAVGMSPSVMAEAVVRSANVTKLQLKP